MGMENSTPLILAIDTTTGRSSVALWQGSVIASKTDEIKGQQSRTLVPMIEEVLAMVGKTYADCDAVACALGPGGFTSVRVGVTTARSIAMVAAKPMIGVGSLDVIAAASGLMGDVVAIIDAHREQFYVQRFRANGVPVPMSQPLLVEEQALKALAHGAKRAQEEFTAEDVARLASIYWAEGKREFPMDPVYIREPDAKLPA